MREIKSHIVTDADRDLLIHALGENGPGGAENHYTIETHSVGTICDIHFQNGPVPENGINGVTLEALIAICMDRLRGFQSGPFPSRENAIAITKLEEALQWLFNRTITRAQRGVEGKLEK